MGNAVGSSMGNAMKVSMAGVEPSMNDAMGSSMNKAMEGVHRNIRGRHHGFVHER